jgi:hypothetical protein
MLPAPLLHTLDFALSAEVRSIGKLVSPPALTGHLAGLTTRRSRTVRLVMAVTVLGTEEDAATSALAPAYLGTHQAPSRKKRTKKSKEKTGSEEHLERRRKKSFQCEQPKKIQSEEDGISNRRFSGSFILPLTV